MDYSSIGHCDNTCDHQDDSFDNICHNISLFYAEHLGSLNEVASFTSPISEAKCDCEKQWLYVVVFTNIRCPHDFLLKMCDYN